MYDGGDQRGLPLWDENQLSFKNIKAMDTPTFIEWLDRQFESPEETERRREYLREKHALWHKTVGGIWTCCMTFGYIDSKAVTSSLFSVNETRREIEDISKPA